MDNDVHGTITALVRYGHHMALKRSAPARHRDSHNAYVLEFRSQSGWTALYTAVAADADYVLIPERNPADYEGMFATLREVKKRRKLWAGVVAERAITPILRVG
jgi:6-phosphofructokinase